MKLILVCGPWSSGTSAVSGMLDALGLDGFGPYFRTNDQRTRNSFESLAFRQVVDSVASDQTLALSVPPKEVVARMQDLKAKVTAQREASGVDVNAPLFLKYPLSALVIPQVCRVFDTRLVYVLRPGKDIEATRERRQWSENFGAKGSQLLYSRMFQILLERDFPTLIVRYPELLRAPMQHARQLAAYAGLKDATPEQLKAAADFVRKA
jgi:hypothetical protein